MFSVQYSHDILMSIALNIVQRAFKEIRVQRLTEIMEIVASSQFTKINNLPSRLYFSEVNYAQTNLLFLHE